MVQAPTTCAVLFVETFLKKDLAALCFSIASTARFCFSFFGDSRVSETSGIPHTLESASEVADAQSSVDVNSSIVSSSAIGLSDLEPSVADPSVFARSESDLPRPQVTDLWSRSLSRLKREMNDHLFSAYVEPLDLAAVSLHRREFVVGAPSVFIRNHVERTFSDVLLCVLRQESEAFREIDAHSFGLKFLVDSSLQARLKRRARPEPLDAAGFLERSAIPHAAGVGSSSLAVGGARSLAERESPLLGSMSVGRSQSPGPRAGIGLRVARTSAETRTSLHDRRVRAGLNPRYTFQNFVVGNSNQFCNAAAQRVAEEPGRNYNPLFIYGGVGLGKTHLLHAIGNAVLDRHPSARVVYMSSETFTNELIQALRNAKMDEFKRKMRSVELLLIDDIQFMCGKERTQEEFFHTFNTLYNAKHQIVITSDKVPQDIPGLEERLQTRFSWGLTADLQAPDFETRVAIIRRKAALDGVSLPQDVAQFIAEKISSNVRELEGALTRLHAISSLQKVDLTLEVAASALKPLIQPKQTSISVDDIKKVVSQHFGIKVSEIISKRRTKNLSFPRHIAMYLCRKHTTASYPEIGGHFGNRDHSSVIHAAGVVSTKVSTDEKVRDLVAEIERRLLAS